MTKKEFMMGYLEAEARIRLKKAQADGEFPSEALASEIAELEAKRKAVLAAIESAPKAEKNKRLPGRKGGDIIVPTKQ